MTAPSRAAPAQGSPRADAFRALIVDDDPGVRQSLRLCLESAGARVLGVGTGAAALAALERSPFDVVLLDLWLGAESGLDLLAPILELQPDAGIVVITAYASFETAVVAMKRGAADYLPKPFTPDQVRVATGRVLETRRLRTHAKELETELAGSDAPAWFDTKSAAFRAFLDKAARAAASDAVVLIRGESGTGKSLIARWMRAQSLRKTAPFVSVNCPSLSSDLMSSVFFGHKKGSFAGAISDSVGKVQEAEGGTLFLDGVGDLVPDAQARLLRFLNDRTYERLGDAKERLADVRLLAATNKPLEEYVHSGAFREDLFFRLDVLSVTVPPLRDRREDIEPLAHHYLSFFASKQGRSNLRLSEGAASAMTERAWPGNLRELRNAIERAVILAAGPVLQARDLGLDSATAPAARAQVGALVGIDELEREHIAAVIARTHTLDGAAKVLGIDATTLQRKRKRYGLT